MKHLSPLKKYFWKYRIRLGIGILFILLSNYFAVLSPQVTGFVIHYVQKTLSLPGFQEKKIQPDYAIIVNRFIDKVEHMDLTMGKVVTLCGLTIILLALLRGFFMFLMRQTIIVMSRHIEFDQKNEVFSHYQDLDTNFFKSNKTGDLMSRISEDISRVRSFTGPAIMYLFNLIVLISLSLFFMFKRDVQLTLYVLAPLPILAITIYLVNSIINRKSEKIQSLLSDLTTNAQESYSGIRVIKSFVQEKSIFNFFNENSEAYKKNAISLAKVEALYFPSMTLLIGLSTLLTIMIGGLYYINGHQSIGIDTIVEFIIYINMLTFPVSAIGWTASMIQRAAASQKRLNEFLDTKPDIVNAATIKDEIISVDIIFDNVNFIYPHTNIQALRNFSLRIKQGEKIAIIGKTGSGKSSVAQLLLRMYEPSSGEIRMNNHLLKSFDLYALREQISYVPQEVFLFSESIENNIRFGSNAEKADVKDAAIKASIDDEIMSFNEGYSTLVGERGVTLSGGQKQRIAIARALIKDSKLLILDDCLSAVDAKTESNIIGHLQVYLKNKTAIIITHRIFSLFQFDKIVVLDDGAIIELGTHEELLSKKGYYAELYRRQQEQDSHV